MSSNESHPNDEILQLLNDNDFIFRIGKNKKTVSDKLQLMILKLLIILWEQKEDEDLATMEEKLRIIDDVRSELSFLRAKYYKAVFNRKTGIVF